MEPVDIYDCNRKKKGYIKVRGRDRLEPGEFIIGVGALLINSDQKILISKRTMNKDRYPGYWELNGGGVAQGEESADAVVREIKEELGINLNKEEGLLLKTFKNDYKFFDLWAFKVDVELQDLVLAEWEVEKAEWVDFGKIEELKKQNIFVDSSRITVQDFETAKKLLLEQ